MNDIWIKEFAYVHNTRKRRLIFNDLNEQTLKQMEKNVNYNPELMNQNEISDAFTIEYNVVLAEYEATSKKDFFSLTFLECFEKVSLMNQLILKLLYSNLYFDYIYRLPKAFNKIICCLLNSKRSASSIRDNMSFWESCTFDLLVLSIRKSYEIHRHCGLGKIYPSIGLEGFVHDANTPQTSELLIAVIENEKRITKEFRPGNSLETNESSSFNKRLSCFPYTEDALKMKISRSRKKISQKGGFYIGAKHDRIFEHSVFTKYTGDFGVGRNVYLRSITSKKFEKPSKRKKIKAVILDCHKNRSNSNREIKFDKIFSIGEQILASVKADKIL